MCVFFFPRPVIILACEMTSFIVAGGMGAVVNYAIFSQYLPSTTLSMDYLLKEFGTVTNTGEAFMSMVQPLTGLRTFLPAIFGFLGGTLLLFVWNWLKSIAVRRLLEYDGWMLRPKNPINKVSKLFNSTFFRYLCGLFVVCCCANNLQLFINIIWNVL